MAGGKANIAGTTGWNGGYGGGSGNGAGGGGGGSFDAGASQARIAGVHSGNGAVEIDSLATPVPEPASIILIGIAFAGLADDHPVHVAHHR